MSGPTKGASLVVANDGTEDCIHLQNTVTGEVLAYITAGGFMHGTIAHPSPPLVGSFTTTASPQDVVPIPGAYPTSTVSLTPTNAVASALFAAGGIYVSAKANNQITLTHPGTAGATFDFIVIA